MKQHPLILVNQDRCIHCKHCIKVCPAMIFEETSTQLSVNNEEACIGCGHCVAVCPSTAITHSEFPPECIHPINHTLIPHPQQLMELIKARRSNRAFSDKMIPHDTLIQIIEAAHRAPTASNLQQVSFTLITDPKKLAFISQFTVNHYRTILKKLEHPFLKPLLKKIMPDNYNYIPTFRRLIREHEAGNDLILRGAKAVILIHTPKSCRFGCEDSNLAYQNGSLMAESLGVAQFYTGFVCSVTKQTSDLAQGLEITGTIHAGMALGIPTFHFPRYIDKKPLQLQKL